MMNVSTASTIRITSSLLFFSAAFDFWYLAAEQKSSSS